MEYKEGGCYFFEYRADSLAELLPVLGKSCQIVGYFGVDPEESPARDGTWCRRMDAVHTDLISDGENGLL